MLIVEFISRGSSNSQCYLSSVHEIQSVNPLTRIAEATGPANSPAKQADRNESCIAWLLYVHGISGAFFPFSS